MEDNAKTIAVATPRDTAAEDEKLVQDCLNGDEKAWNRLIDKYKRLIYSVPVKYGLSPDDAADVFAATPVQGVDEFAFVVALQEVHLQSVRCRPVADQAFDVGNRVAAVDLGLSGTEHIQVGTVQDQDAVAHGSAFLMVWPRIS